MHTKLVKFTSPRVVIQMLPQLICLFLGLSSTERNSSKNFNLFKAPSPSASSFLHQAAEKQRTVPGNNQYVTFPIILQTTLKPCGSLHPLARSLVTHTHGTPSHIPLPRKPNLKFNFQKFVLRFNLNANNLSYFHHCHLSTRSPRGGQPNSRKFPSKNVAIFPTPLTGKQSSSSSSSAAI